MKVLLDTNIILDIALNRQPHVEHAVNLFETLRVNLRFYVTASSITDIYYITKKHLNHAQALEFILDLLNCCELPPLTKEVFENSAKSNFKDFEDAVQYFCAKYAGIEAIITRNEKDFKESSIAVYSPEDFLKQY